MLESYLCTTLPVTSMLMGACIFFVDQKWVTGIFGRLILMSLKLKIVSLKFKEGPFITGTLMYRLTNLKQNINNLCREGQNGAFFFLSV